MKKIQGVIFDMDGLLLDSERLYAATSRKVLVQMGFVPNEALIISTMGTTDLLWMSSIKEFYGDSFDGERFKADCQEEMRVWYEETGIPLKDGAVELLDYLRQQGIPAAVASSTYSPRGHKALEKAGVHNYFDTFVFGEMVAKSKPEPDIFLEAARRLGLAPTHCMGLEDSRNGLRACRGAGLYTVMVPDMQLPDDALLSITDGCVASLRDIIPLLGRLNGEERDR
ncbi:MAG: HAD family phosphatase [Angelakisella sp.]